MRIVRRDFEHLGLDVDREAIERHRPRPCAFGALGGDDGEAFHDERRALVLALGALERNGTARVRHGIP